MPASSVLRYLPEFVQMHVHWVQFCSATQSYLTLCNPMDCSTPGFPVHHQLPELAQTHVHWVSDAIQPSRPLSSPSPPTFNLSQKRVFSKQSVLFFFFKLYIIVLVLPNIKMNPPQVYMCRFFVSGSQSIGASASATVLWSWFHLGLTGSISLLSKGLSRVFSSKTIQKPQFFGTQPSLWSNSHICTWLLEKP